MIVMGIDPGINGGVAIIGYSKDPILKKMPTLKLGKDTIVDTSTIYSYLFQSKPDAIFIESLLVFPGKSSLQTVSTAGKNWGRIMGIIEYLDHTPEVVMPKDWQKGLLVPHGAHEDIKERVLERAKILFPNVNFIPRGCKNPHDGMVDALMIAKYGQMKLGG